MGKKRIRLFGFYFLLSVFTAIVLIAYFSTNNVKTTIASHAGPPAGCPAGTGLLFTNTGNLKDGDSVNFGGTIVAIEFYKKTDWRVKPVNGVLMAEIGKKLTVDFPGKVLLDTVFIFDNDPKSVLGEVPWKINGVSLPTTGPPEQSHWALPFKLNKIAGVMDFDYGGDSPHFNVCVKNVAGPAPIPKPPIPNSSLSGNVFIDTNSNGTRDGLEGVYTAGATVKLRIVGGGIFAQTTTDGAGDYSFLNVPADDYRVTITVPNGYSSTTPINSVVSIPPVQVINFGIVGKYVIEGTVFNDINKNLKLDAGETSVAGTNINSSGGTEFMNNGVYSIENLNPGTYIVSLTSLPNGFYMLYPKPPSFQVTVGPGCAVDGTTGASCSGDDIVNLNFAATDSMPWIQTYGLDLRIDNGFTNLLPASTSCGGGSFASGTTGGFSSPGIIFTGDTSSDFGQGSASNKNWVVGGISYPEVFTSSTPLKIATQNLLAAADRAGITINQLDSFGPCKNPSVKCNLQGLQKGFYYYGGDLKLNKSADFNNGNYVIVVGGTITLGNNIQITVSTDSTAMFSAGRDIVVDPTIHAGSNTCPVPAGQMQGIFSADRHIIIEGNNGNCALADTMLNIDGALIANAAKISGRLQNERDLCADNRSYPALTIKARPDFILNTPGFLTQQHTISHEETP